MKTDAKTTPKAHDIRALINALLRAELTWEEYLEPLDSSANAIAYTADYQGKTYVIAASENHFTFFGGTDITSLVQIGTSETDGIRPVLTGLYRHAEHSYNEWINEMCNCYFRQCFGDVVSIRDLFRMIDHPERLAEDAADEKTYLAVNAGKLQSETEILDFHRRSRREALRAIRSIIGCKKETDSILPIDDHDSNPLNWRVKIPDDFPAGKTDLHLRVCPTYHSEEADGDMNREYAVEFAALVILLSL